MISNRKFKEIMQDYQPNELEDDDKWYEFKDIIMNHIPSTARTYILLYADTGSLRKMAEIFGNTTATTMLTNIRKARQDLFKALKEHGYTKNNN